jgi:AbiV family abortive infection protein
MTYCHLIASRAFSQRKNESDEAGGTLEGYGSTPRYNHRMAKARRPQADLNREHLIMLAKKSLQNARELVKEAELLFDNKRWARTVFLCHTAGEEFGKSVQCFTAVMDHARGVLDFVKFRKRFLSHLSKTTTIRFFEAMMSPEDDHLIDEIKGLEEEVSALLQGRNATLYSDMFSDGTVFAPSDIIPEKMASDALSWAKGRLAMADVLIKPILESDVLRAKDEELKKRYDEFMGIINDPERREELRKKVTSEEQRSGT